MRAMTATQYEKDLQMLVRDKYEGNAEKVTQEDKERLAAGEPLAYVIGWIPFLGLSIDLTSRPLIPRPETEFWTEQLLVRLHEKFGDTADKPFSFLDLCAGSGAIGLAVLKAFPNAQVSFGELMPEHVEQIKKNIVLNSLDASRADVRESYLFESFRNDIHQEMRFNVIAINPPYIPGDRELEASVTNFEPLEALYSGPDGLELIRDIAIKIDEYLFPKAEVWLEADTSNIETAAEALMNGGAVKTEILCDQYDRQRVVVSYYS
ncbi:MAG: prmA [Parcubacteria group bacterium]|nr:prmA [Parcubacteria group bacterium]